MFKDRLKQLRIDKGLTQSDLAMAIGVTASTIGNYEQGIRVPRKNVLKRLSDYFLVSEQQLLDEDISEKPLYRNSMTPYLMVFITDNGHLNTYAYMNDPPTIDDMERAFDEIKINPGYTGNATILNIVKLSN